MEALILAAGFSKRLQPLTLTQAKPLLPVGGRPMIDYIVDKVGEIDDVKRVLVVCNGKFHQNFVEWSSHSGATVVNDGTMDNEQRLGAIGDIDLVIQKERVDDDLLVVAGDNLFEASLSEFVEAARKHAPDVSIGVVDFHDRERIKGRYGIVELEPSGQVKAFYEKPSDPVTTLVSTGIYYFPKEQLPKIHQYLEEGGKADNIGHLIGWLVDKVHLKAHTLEGEWLDIGDHKSYEEANQKYSK